MCVQAVWLASKRFKQFEIMQASKSALSLSRSPQTPMQSIAHSDYSGWEKRETGQRKRWKGEQNATHAI